MIFTITDLMLMADCEGQPLRAWIDGEVSNTETLVEAGDTVTIEYDDGDSNRIVEIRFDDNLNVVRG